MDEEELRAAVAACTGWVVTGAVAVFTAPPGEWSAVVRPVAAPRARESWHAVVLCVGAARNSRLCGTAVEAVRWAQKLAAAPRVETGSGPGSG